MPNHGCTTINLHDEYHVIRRDVLEAVRPHRDAGKGKLTGMMRRFEDKRNVDHPAPARGDRARRTAERFATEGARLLLADRQAELLDQTAEEVRTKASQAGVSLYYTERKTNGSMGEIGVLNLLRPMPDQVQESGLHCIHFRSVQHPLEDVCVRMQFRTLTIPPGRRSDHP